MKKNTFILSVVALSTVSLAAFAAERMWIQRNDRIALGMPVEIADSVALSTDGSNALFTINTASGATSISKSLITNITFAADSGTPIVEIKYDGTDAEIINPYAFEGISVVKSGADVVVTSTSADEITYQLTGTTTTGSFKIYSDKKFVLNLNSVSITNDNGAAINIQSGKKCTVNLTGTSSLTDASSYTSVSGEDQKGCFFSEGQLIFTGDGVLNVTANYKHGICSDDYIDIQSGTVNVLKAANDGVRVNDYFLMTGGKLTTTSTVGDGIDGDAGYIKINDGTIDVTVSTADTKGIKSDSIIVMNGGTVKLTVSAAQGKGFKTKQSMEVNGGIINATMTGAAVVESNDPSYCTAIKTDGDFVQNNGSITINHTGTGGKGISADGNVTIAGGDLTVSVSGTYATYTNTSSVTDMYSSTCVSADGAVNVKGGTTVLNVKAIAAKGLKSDGNTTISGGSITGTLTGNAVVVNYDPSYCTLVKCDGNLTMNGGSISATHSGKGGKGISVDGVATFNAGTVGITTSGAGSTYTASSGTDTYSSACITVDGNLNLLGGTFNLKATGQAGKCIKCDQVLTMGTADGVSVPTSSISFDQVWNYSQTSGNTASWMTYGSQGVEDITVKDGKLYAVCRGTGITDHSIKIVNAYTGAVTGELPTTTCTAGTYDISSIENMGGTIVACNLSNSTSTNFVIYKWTDESAEPTVMLNAALPCARLGDAMSVSGNMTSGRIWFVYGSVVYYYTVSNGAITSTTPSTINLTKSGSAYEIASGNAYSNITVESDGSFWVSSSLQQYAATHFSSSGVYIEELGSTSQSTDTKFFTVDGTEYAAMSTYLNSANTTLSDAAVTIVEKSTGSSVGTYPSSGLGTTRNTSFRNSVCTEVTSDAAYVWVNVPYQGAACYKYTIASDDDSGSTGTIAALVVSAQTTGAQLGSSSSQPGGGSSSSNTSSSPKVIKSTGNMNIYSGSFTIKSSNEGGEGLESKATMTINGGNFYFSTYDDCINASTKLVVNGGSLRAVSTGNDAIDSNGTMSITGGLILANGTSEPEEGIDVDQASQLSITGGTIINQRGNMLNLTTSQCKVPTLKYSTSITAGTRITVTDSSGNCIVSFTAPQKMSQGCYITHPSFKTGSSYKLYTGGSVSGGTTFNEVTNGGTYTAGTLKKSFTISSNLTSL